MKDLDIMRGFPAEKACEYRRDKNRLRVARPDEKNFVEQIIWPQIESGSVVFQRVGAIIELAGSQEIVNTAETLLHEQGFSSENSLDDTKPTLSDVLCLIRR